MSLINCPECKQQISDKSDKCIHCGYPINNTNTECIINGMIYNVSFLLNENISIPQRGKQLHLLTKGNLKDCLEIAKKIDNTKQIPDTLYIKQQTKVEEKSTPKCPHCSSTNIKSLSGLDRGTSIAMLGIFSKKINKSFECCSCKYTW